MADNGEDLVSQIRILGSSESAAEVQAFADSGAASFDKLNKSAARAAAGVAASSDTIAASGKKAGQGLSNLNDVGNVGQAVAGRIKDIENAVSSLTSKLPQLTQAVGRFTQRLALVGAAGIAAAVGLAAVAAKIAKEVDGTSNALEKQTAAQIDANNSALAGENASINYSSALRKLGDQLKAGTITSVQYNQQVQQLNKDFDEQARVSAEVEAAQRRVKEQNDALTKSLKDRTAYQGLIDTFGGPLLASMTSFGRQIQQIHTQILNAFGPTAANVIDLISKTLSNNSVAIGKFFDDASKRIDALLKTNGPQIVLLLENIGSATAAVFNGVISAAPALIDFFNNTLVPVIGKVAAAFNGLADAINFVFGTHLTGGSIFLIALLAQMTGSIRLLFSLMRVGGAVFKGFIGLLESIGLAIAEAFGLSKVAGIVKVGAAATKSGGLLKTFLAVVRTLIPFLTVLAEGVAVALGVSFGTAAIAIAALTAAIIFLITKIDWKAFAAAAVVAIQSVIAFLLQLLQGAKNIGTGIITAFQAVNQFFATLGTQISTALTAAWDLILAGAKATVNAVVAAWNGTGDLIVEAWQVVVAFFQAFPANLTTIFTALWISIVAGVTAAVQLLITGWTVFVDFMKALPDQINQFFVNMGTAVVATVQGWVQQVVGFFQSLLAQAKAFLQPIIDLLNTIASLSGSAGGGGDGQSVSAAGGGHIQGPGTSTSDSIAAWLSNNEFVMKAKAVAKYGLGFMHAINSGTFRMPKFALGGPVSMMAPMPRMAYADGGAVNAGKTMRPLNLNLFGEEFAGLMAPEDVGSRLAKFAISRQNKSAGRKPAWVGGRN